MSTLLWKADRGVPAWVRNNIQYLLLPVAFGLFLWLWETLIAVQQYPSFILPGPREVAQSWSEYWQRGIFQYHMSITLFEVLLGFSIALAFAASVGYLLAKLPLLEKIVSPYLVATQAIPLVAIAPLIIIWISTGIVQNALIAAMISFFPMLINTIVGVRSIRAEYRALLRSFAATHWHVFSKLEVPAALPIFLGGVRVGVTLSVIGVVVAELMWADRGLGFLINFAQGHLDTPLLFATVITLSMMAITLYLVVVLIEKIFLRWRKNIQ